MGYEIPRRHDLFIANQWQGAGSARRLEIVSPLTGATLSTVPDADAGDVDRAVMAALAAAPGWAATTPRQRQEMLWRLAERLMAEIDRLAWLETANTGKPDRESRANILTAVDRLRYYAGALRAFEGAVTPVGGSILSLNLRESLGVVGMMGAWNFPLNMFLGKIAPAIATGNAVVYKPAEATPITTFAIARLAAEIFPPGVINVITGAGETTGAAMVAHPGIRKISLTGAVETGRRVLAAAGPGLKQVTLELGGKNAQIVYPDADIERATQGILLGAFLNQGQVCTAGSRIFVHDSIAATLSAKLEEATGRLVIGDPFAKTTTLGTLISRAHLEAVEAYVAIGEAEGAKLLTGGRRVQVPQYPNGLFFAPTLFTEVTMEMRIAREEIFGPVATIHPWSDEEAMLAEVNGLDFALAAGIWTRDFGRAHRLARAVAAGRVWINCYNLFPSGAAFGGMKASGFGREDAFETMLAFTQVKNVIADIAAEQRSFYG